MALLRNTLGRCAATSAAVTAAAMILTPAAALAAGKPGGPHTPPKPKALATAFTAGKPGGPHTPAKPKPPAPKPAAGPVQTVTKLAAPKVLTSARALTLSAHVSPTKRTVGAPAETGSVIFTIDGTASAPIPLAANKATDKVKLASGHHTISAKYSGDAAHAPSASAPLTITVN